MQKEELKKALNIEKEKYATKSFEELSKITEPLTYECGSGKNWYQVEVQLLEKNDKYVHVSIAVDDGKLFRAIFPLTTSVVVNKLK